MSTHLEVDSNIVVEAWLNDRKSVPDSAIVLLMQIDALISQACENIIKPLRSQNLSIAPVNKIPVIVYPTQTDFQIYCEDAETFGSVRIHQEFVIRVISKLRQLGFNAYRVSFNQCRYVNWLQSQGYQNSNASRALWAAQENWDN